MARTTTLRAGISDLVNDLQIVAKDTDDADLQQKVQSQVKVLMLLWQEVIFEQLDRTSSDYIVAIEALDDSKKAAVAARKDLKKTTDAVARAADAIKALDKVLGFTAKILG